ncbi:MAG: hypothetical protein Q7U08_04685 [Flavobacteriaceae bacterium]|nr:hypothetical protein [Flavobacteriaceae bacterium]
MMPLLYLIQQPNFQEKLNKAPLDYQIAFFISSYLPYVIFVAIVYFIYYKSKNKKDGDN